MTIPKQATTTAILIGVGALLAFQGLCWITLGDPLYGGYAFYITLGGFAFGTMTHLGALLRDHYDHSLDAHTSHIVQEITANRRMILARIDELETTEILKMVPSQTEQPAPFPRLRIAPLRIAGTPTVSPVEQSADA